MESSIVEWSSTTQTYTSNTNYYYNPFRSAYKNIRYMLTTASTYTVTKSDMGRIAMISYIVYGTTTLWRVILEYNSITDPITQIYPGVILNIPDKSQAVAYLSNYQNTQTSDLYPSSFVI